MGSGCQLQTPVVSVGGCFGRTASGSPPLVQLGSILLEFHFFPLTRLSRSVGMGAMPSAPPWSLHWLLWSEVHTWASDGMIARMEETNPHCSGFPGCLGPGQNTLCPLSLCFPAIITLAHKPTSPSLPLSVNSSHRVS